MTDHDEIYLQPVSTVDPDIGRGWSDHDLTCEHSAPWTAYVRKDLHVAELDRLRAELVEKNAALIKAHDRHQRYEAEVAHYMDGVEILRKELAEARRAQAGLARHIFAIGDDVIRQDGLKNVCQRIQFMGGTYPHAETDNGGMTEPSLASAIARYFDAALAAAQQSATETKP
jgi:hypothetical protein